MNSVIAALTIVSAIFGSAAVAAPVIVTESDFDGSETTIDFNSIANKQTIDSQYSGSGVTFSGALIGLTNPGDTDLFNGSTLASNYDYSSATIGASWTATFSSVQSMVGFFSETNTPDSVTIEAFLGLSSVGVLNFLNPNGYIPDFIGIGVGTGFDRIVVTTDHNYNGFFAMDDFRFTSSIQTDVPAPGALALFALGLAGLGLFRRKNLLG